MMNIIRDIVQEKTSQTLPEGHVTAVNQTIRDEEGRVPVLAKAKPTTVAELMPKHRQTELGTTNPELVANISTKTNLIEFIIVKDVAGEGVSLPDKESFDDMTAEAMVDLVRENPDWMNVLVRAEVNRAGVGSSVSTMATLKLLRNIGP